MSGFLDTSVSLPQSLQPTSDDARKVYGAALSRFSPQLQGYLGSLRPEQPITLQTAEAEKPHGYAKVGEYRDKLWHDGTVSPNGPGTIYSAGPWASDRKDVATHELAHLLTENLFGGAPPGTVDMVLDRLSQVGRNTRWFDQDVERAYSYAADVTKLSRPPVFGYDYTVPIPMHEYFASVFNAPGGVAPNTGVDSLGRKWDAKGLLDSLALYQMVGP